MAPEHSNLDSAIPYARGPASAPGEAGWSEFRKVAEEALRKSEAVLRAVTENTPDWLFLLDETLHVRFMNRPFGPNRPELVLGHAFLDFIPQDLRADMEAIYGKALATRALPQGSSCASQGLTAHWATLSTASCRSSKAGRSVLSPWR